MSAIDNNPQPYAVVQFCNENSHLKKLVVDLVPTAWLYTNNNNMIYCFYPEPQDYNQLNDWLASLKEAEKDWNSFPVTVIGYASKYKYFIKACFVI